MDSVDDSRTPLPRRDPHDHPPQAGDVVVALDVIAERIGMLHTVVFDREREIFPTHVEVVHRVPFNPGTGIWVCGRGNPDLISNSRNHVSFGD